jgi:two-component system, OmpR family, phosphate regulon sensor histidine kinase PhoR
MIKPIKNIGLYLIVIILIPILFFIAREIYSLSENESVIEKIYQSQIESLLFSVNQYSEDLVRSWGMKLESENVNSSKNDSEVYPKAKSLFESNKAIQNIFFADATLNNKVFVYNHDEVTSTANSPEIKILLKKNQSLLERLNQYKKNNFTKFEPLITTSSPKIQLLIFMLNDGQICGISFDKQKFVRENLSSKIQSIARDEFSVSVYDSSSNTNVYSTIYQAQDGFVQSRKLWLIPSYSLGISLQGKNLNDILRSRTYSGIILISVLAAMMLLVAWFGYKNIKKEIDLAQIKNEFVSNVSHELRTPLALINMFAETLFMGRVKSEEKKNEYYGIIQQETERLSKIVNKILNFSKIEAGKWKYNFTIVDLNALSERIFLNYKFHLENKNFKFTFESSGNVLNGVLDAEAVSEALINLIDNAVKYSEERKNITIRTGKESDFIYVEVEDFGLGISDEDHKKIFEKFYRIQSGNIHNTKGTGLGLTLVKHIIDAHTGKIKLQSTLNKGSIFRLTFPSTKIS